MRRKQEKSLAQSSTSYYEVPNTNSALQISGYSQVYTNIHKSNMRHIDKNCHEKSEARFSKTIKM